MPTTPNSAPERRAPLYPRLPPGRNTMSRAHVAAHQRARLRGAAVAVLEHKSAADVTVADLISLAGVSRRAFYEHFDSKQACLLGSYEDVLADAAGRVMAAYSRESEPLAGMRAAYEAFVGELVEHPTAARVVFLDVLALGRAAVERGESLRLAFESKMREDGSLLAGLSLHPTVLTGVLAGAWQLARRRLLQDRVADLLDLRCELLAWVGSYSSPAVDSLRVGAVKPILDPRAPTAPPREQDPHKRILRATARLATRDGYRELSPAAIIEAAEVSYEDFFERFQTAEECFLGALELLAAEALANAWRAVRTAEDWVGAVIFAIRAFFDQLAREPSFAPLAFIEAFALGEPALRLREQLLQSVEALYIRHATDPHAPSPLVAEAVVGAIWGLVHDKALRGEADRLPDLSEHTAYIVLAPILGAERAVQRIITARDTPPSQNHDSVKP